MRLWRYRSSVGPNRRNRYVTVQLGELGIKFRKSKKMLEMQEEIAVMCYILGSPWGFISRNPFAVHTIGNK